MAIKSAKKSQHRREGANPRGFEVSAGTQDGREPSSPYACDAQQLGGGRAVSLKTLELETLRLKTQRFKGPKLKT